MVNRPVTGGSAVAFTDANGAQHEIPLSLLQFTDNGLSAAKWPPYAAYQAIVDPWLASLVAQGLLQAGPAPSGKPALLIEARQDATGGDAVSVAFANPDATADTVDVTVSSDQRWTLLTPATIDGVLGETAGAGSQPGLVILTAPPAGTMPAAGEVAGTGDPLEFVVPDQSGGTAFTLAPIYDDASEAADAALLKVTVAPDPTNSWFDLEAQWSKAVAGVKTGDLVSANPFAFLVSFAAPSGGLIGPPDAGAVNLQGGSAAPPAKASATALQG
jgi:hypothetical protein